VNGAPANKLPQLKKKHGSQTLRFGSAVGLYFDHDTTKFFNESSPANPDTVLSSEPFSRFPDTLEISLPSANKQFLG
jgi:hypothetical protein